MADLEEVFGELRKYNMRLNPEKCTFGVGGGKFLGFMVTHRVIEANPNKYIAILEMHNPTNIQEVQRLNSTLASLSRFLPKLAEKVKPFYKLFKKTEPFTWDKTYEQALLAFKKTIVTSLVLSQPLLAFTISKHFNFICHETTLNQENRVEAENSAQNSFKFHNFPYSHTPIAFSSFRFVNHWIAVKRLLGVSNTAI